MPLTLAVSPRIKRARTSLAVAFHAMGHSGPTTAQPRARHRCGAGSPRLVGKRLARARPSAHLGSGIFGRLSFAHFRARPSSKAGVRQRQLIRRPQCRLVSAIATTGATLDGSEDRAPACGMSRGPLVSNNVEEQNQSRASATIKPSAAAVGRTAARTWGASDPHMTTPRNKSAMSMKRRVTPEPASAQRSPLASGSVREHLFRGAVGLAAAMLAIGLVAVVGPISLVLLLLTAAAWRGCPTC